MEFFENVRMGNRLLVYLLVCMAWTWRLFWFVSTLNLVLLNFGFQIGYCLPHAVTGGLKGPADRRPRLLQARRGRFIHTGE